MTSPDNGSSAASAPCPGCEGARAERDAALAAVQHSGTCDQCCDEGANFICSADYRRLTAESGALKDALGQRDAAEARAASLETALADRCARLAEGLEKIAAWVDFPPTHRTWQDGSPMSYSAAFGSNGERDYMRGVALAALAPAGAEAAAPETTDCCEGGHDD